MVAFQPSLVQVGELPVPSDVCRRQVVVVVDDRQPRRVLVVEPAGRLAVEEEVVVDKGREEVHLHHAAIARHRAKHVVRHIARMAGERARR